MKNKVLFFLTICFTIINVYAQKLDCEAYKKGVFYGEVAEPFKIKWKVTRTDSQQIEEVIDLPKEAKEIGYSVNPQYEIIEWIDECTYRLMYDGEKFELSETQMLINQNGGALTKIIKVEDNCYYYVSTILIGDNETSMEGKLCTE